MLKKIVVIAALLLLVGFSFSLITKPQKTETSEPAEVKTPLPKTLFAFTKESLTADCSQKDEQLCAVENAVKCTINPALEICGNLNLPKFIFMQDAGLDRPTEISYKLKNKRVLVNNTVEIFTDSSCNGGWFGLCQGTVIYVLAKPENQPTGWYVKDIYAIE